MDIKDQTKLKALYLKYAEVHDQLNSLDQEVQTLLSRQSKLSQELSQLRADEKELINKIEKDLNRPILLDEIMQIVNNE
jgi:predicted  nucleic acid-binding Zn-ribbon protein